MNLKVSQTASTCFHRRRNKPNAPPPFKRRRSRPMSMMRSNTTSVMSELRIVGLVLSKLSTVQVFCSDDHVARTYGCEVSLPGPKQSKSNIHPYNTCDINRFTRDSPMICRRHLPLMRNETSVIHMPIVVIKTTLFLPQMAILRASLDASLREDDHDACETYIRSTINSEEVIKTR
jgi:hypothetical protein